MDHSDFEDLLDNFTEGHLHIVTDMDALMLFDHGNGIMMEHLDQGQYEQLARSLDVITYIGSESDVQLEHLRNVAGDEADVRLAHISDREVQNDIDDTFIVMAAIKLRNDDISYYCVHYYDVD